MSADENNSTTPAFSVDPSPTATDLNGNHSRNHGSDTQNQRLDSNATLQETQRDRVSEIQPNSTVEDLSTVNVEESAQQNSVSESLIQMASNVPELTQSTQQSTKRRLLEDASNAEKGATAENEQQGVTEEAADSFRVFTEEDDEAVTDEYNYDYDDYVDESMWGDEEWTESEHEKQEDFVHIDAHILATPVRP